jgi:hypothetical protein
MGVLALPVGGLAGLVGSFLQQWTPHSVPVGVVLALLAHATALVLAGLAGRAPAVRWGAGGWALAVAVMLWPRPEGDLVLAATGEAYTFLLGGLVVTGVALTLASRYLSRAPMQPG